MLRNENEIELEEFNQKEQRRIRAAKNQRIVAMNTAIESASLTAIYGSFFSEAMKVLMKKFGEYILFSGFGFLKVLEAGLAWRQAYIDKKPRSIVQAVVETLAAAALLTVIIGGFAAAAAFAAVTPIIFTAVSAAKTIYNAGKAIYFAGKAAGTKKTAKKEQYKTIAKTSAISASIGAIATAATVCVFLLGMTGIGFAAIGVIGGILALSAAIYFGVKAHRAAKLRKQPPGLDNTQESNTAHIQQTLSRNSSPELIVKNEISNIQNPPSAINNINNETGNEQRKRLDGDCDLSDNQNPPSDIINFNNETESENEETPLLKRG